MKYVPKHRQPVKATDTPKKVLRTTLVLSSVAVATTGATVTGGLFADGLSPQQRDSTDKLSASSVDQAELNKRLSERLAKRDKKVPTRSDRREATDPAKVAALSGSEGGGFAKTEDLSDDDPRDIARALLGEYGFSVDEFDCLDALYMSESGWRVDADNPTSSAYGIPQALTAMHDLPEGYMTSAEVQIRWGLDYIQSRYGTPCAAWSFKQGHNWY
ncbi:hypothetical protein [Nocardioides speluncae]|uniref:aggregation-promoting factor C-terminal-like domain-containing protein n=1 Tax=Nocardioides speluncae TaxID=2670337 RepID=UPI000D6966A5|nr:hypothetical protein [Nocardioides speluncae]